MCLRYRNSRQDSGRILKKELFTLIRQDSRDLRYTKMTELHPEYEGQTNTGINITNLGPYYTEIKYFLECLQDGKEITLAPLQEGVKSVEQALEEWEAAKLYLREKKEMYI